MIRSLLLATLLATPAFADDLLGSARIVFSTGNEEDYTKVVSVSFELGHDISSSLPICVSQRVGCTPIPLAQLVPGATFTYGPGSPWFAETAARLTNGTNDAIFHVDRAWSTRPSLLAGVGRSMGSEGTFFGRPGDFHSSTITSITMTVNAFAIGDNASCGGIPGGMCYSADLTWRVYGVPVSVPAPSSSWGRIRATYR